MTKYLQLDQTDKQILHALDPGFEIDASGEVAVLEGDMKIKIVRTETDQLELTVEFAELEFPILMLRSRTKETLGIREKS